MFRKELSGRGGFTLIELLVVISIIALLIGILLPALGLSRESGRQSQCLSNMRGWGQGQLSFAASNKSALPQDGDDNPGYSANGTNDNTPCILRNDWWANAVPDYLGQSRYRDITANASATGTAVPQPLVSTSQTFFTCPDQAQPEAADVASLPAGTTFVANKGYVILPKAKKSGSKASQDTPQSGPNCYNPALPEYYMFTYVPNTKLKKYLVSLRGSTAATNTAPEMKVTLDSMAVNQSKVIMMMESRTTNSEITGADADNNTHTDANGATVPNGWAYSKDFARAKADWQRMTARHNFGGSNAGGMMVFADGHSRFVTFNEATTSSDGIRYPKPSSGGLTLYYNNDGTTNGINQTGEPGPATPGVGYGGTYNQNTDKLIWDAYAPCWY